MNVVEGRLPVAALVGLTLIAVLFEEGRRGLFW